MLWDRCHHAPFGPSPSKSTQVHKYNISYECHSYNYYVLVKYLLCLCLSLYYMGNACLIAQVNDSLVL